MGRTHMRKSVALLTCAVALLFSVPAAAQTAPTADGAVTSAATELSWFYSLTVNATTLDVQWFHDGPVRTGGNVHWELLAVRGDVEPVGNPAAKRFVIPVAGARNYGNARDMEFRQRFSGLVPDALYVFAIRGVAADGGVSPWRHHGAATRIQGVYLSSGRTGPAGRVTPLPEKRDDTEHSFAVEPTGTAHIGIDDGYSDKGATVYGVVPPGGTWATGTLPDNVKTSRRPPLTFATSRTRSGVVAMTDGACAWLRTSFTAWRSVGCLDDSVGGDDDFFHTGYTKVSGLQVDRRNKLHALWVATGSRGVDSFRYGTNASGRWTIRDVSAVSPDGNAQLAYDPITDRVILVMGDSHAKGSRYQLRVTGKASRATGFEPFSTTYDNHVTRAVVPTSLASYGGRISIAASRSNVVRGYGIHWGTPVLLSGMSPATVGGMVSIPGALADHHPDSLVTAVSATRVIVGVANGQFGARQGVWTTPRDYVGNVGTWGKDVRQTASAYDRLAGLAVDGVGRTYVLFKRED